MAASAYAFLVSLTNTIDQIQLHPFTSTCFDKTQFETLRKKVNFLQDFVENHAHVEEGEEDLLRRIAAVAQKAEDMIEVEAADRIRGRSTEISSNFLPGLQEKTEEMDGIINEDIMIKVKDRKGMSRSQDEYPPPASSVALPPPSSAPSPSTAMVGFDGYLNKLLDELNGYHSGRQILPIIGMGGVGKTTLARNVYENPLMVESFTVRAWVTVSQTFTVSDIFKQALSCLGKSSSGTTDDDEVGKQLRKTLYDRRYLVVLDDMWSVEAWEKIKFYFPDNSNRSRIVVTTREQQLVAYFGSSSSSSSSAVAVSLLDEENSWKLFCSKTFSKEGGCPPQLGAIGRKIVRKCRGLPLAIDLMGGLLRRSPGTQEYWKKIEQDKSLILEYSGEESNKPLSILYLSYKHLPVCYRPCFLYLGLFPEDYRIDVSELIRLWIGEGFIKPKANLTLEEVAGSYVKELVDRNLVLVGALRLNKKFRTCFLHDLVRELCIWIADEENFYCVQRDLAGERHLIVDPTTASSHPTSLYRPLLFQGERVAAPFTSRLLRVLVSPLIKGAGEEVNLRFLSNYNRNLDYMSNIVLPPKLPSSISLFWSLQTILFHKTLNGVLLHDIWKMPQLRHVEVSPLRLPDPPPTGCDAIVLNNLQTLKRVWNLNLSDEVCKRIPEIKELGIRYISQGAEDWDEAGHFNLQNVGCLNKLESLRCSLRRAVALKNLTLPNSLKELSLCRCLLPWSYMTVIGLLPRLQILHLLERAMVGAEWNLCEEDEDEEKFISLKYLRIEKCDDLIRWDADASNFPVLETLCLKKLSKLEEIPSGVGDIPTLERMYVHGCSGTAAMSAIRILEEQESLENLDLRLDIRFFEWSEAEMLNGKVQELGIGCRNLHISFFS